LQIDIGVRDKRAPLGWVFATFTYDKDAYPFVDYEFPRGFPSDRTEELSRWLHIKPLGIIFGNDPEILIGAVLHETRLNTSLGIPQHYGCGDTDDPLKRRLNGPVDNPVSSCISCHALAETPKNLNNGTIAYDKMECADESIGQWFKNINPRDPISPTYTPSTPLRQMLSLDYSLQLREGIRRYCVESYALLKDNICNLSFVRGQNYSVVKKDGIETFTIR
jgi:hypothetical protein